ncbi:hypothetical protein BaRGS_00021714, partial [Batillaria attramentaria]
SSHGRGRGRIASGSTASSYSPRPHTAPRREPKVKVQMQHLHMTMENQEMVRDMLKSLHGDDHSIPSDNEYDELDTRDDDHYWQTERPLFVESVHPYAATHPNPPARHSQSHSQSQREECVANPVAVQKLQRCGFSRPVCEEALQVCDGDVGAALEYLLTELQNLDQAAGSDPSADAETENTLPVEIAELREEEKLALQSIFEHRFEERLPNRVWVLHLELPELKELLNLRGNQVRKEKKPVCKFYQRGSCRFGDRCKMSHVLDLQTSHGMAKQAEKLQGPLADNLFSLEIRFPTGNMYPKQVPLLAFSSATDRLPPHGCLNIARYLMQAAQEWADLEQSAIFSLISLLEDRDQLQNLLDSPPPVLFGERPAPSVAKDKRPQSHSAHSHPDSVSSRRQGSSSVYRASEHTSSSRQSSARGSEARPKHDKNPTALNSGDSDRAPKTSGKGRDSGEQYSANQPDRAANVLKQNRKLKEDFKKKQQRLADRQKLPAWKEQDNVLAALEGGQVVVISGMTGCGKTTQVPQFILDQHLQTRDAHLCNIVCTQPRRISAIAVAQRVADERAEKLGNSVGYQIRLESVQSSSTRLLFCTTGIILRRLEGDPLLSDVTHLIVDEVHERSEDSDFLLMILRDILPERPDLKIILMSATLNAELFSSYFYDCPMVEIPGKTYPVEPFFLEDALEITKYVVEDNSPYARLQKKSSNVSGKKKKDFTLSYADAIEESLMGLSLQGYDEDDEPSDRMRDDKLNVKQLMARYPDCSKRTIRTMALMDLEKINYDLILLLLEWIVSGDHSHPKEGGILIFLPGFAEIQTMLDTLLSSSEFGHRNKAKYRIVPLHSTLSSEEQNAVFAKPKEGVTKIVIATNIAETSITIDDIVYVIDAGRMKEKQYDSARSMESLETVWVSKANALQRRGRAGRVTSGVCFHLFTSHRFEYHLREQPIPEIQRVPLEQLMIRIKMLDMFESCDAMEILSNVVEPPSEEAMENALRRLQDVGALDEELSLTALGYHLGSLPVDVRLGKLMLFGAIFRCLDSALTIAAALSFKSPFVSPFSKKDEADEKRKEFAVGNSDYLTILNAYKQWLEVKKGGRREEYEFCQENFLSMKTLQMLANLKQQYVELLSDIGFTHKPNLRLRMLQRAARETGGDGVVEATGPEANIHSKNWKLISAILVGALYPNVVQVMTPEARYSQSSGGAVMKAPNAEELRFATKSDGFVHVHPSSVNFQVRHYESPYLVYHEKVKTSKVYIRDCTMVSVYSLLLFGGNHISIDLDRGNFVLSVDEGWIRFMASSSQVAELLKELRLELDKLLEDKISNPNMDLATCPRG